MQSFVHLLFSRLKHYRKGMWVFLGFFFIGGSAFAFADTIANSHIYLRIVNTFNAETTLVSTGYSSGSTVYLPSTQIIVQVHASTGSDFALGGGDIVEVITGSGIGNYTQIVSTTISTGDGIKTLPSIYAKGDEVIVADPLSVFLDQTPPSKANPFSPLLGETFSGSIHFERNASIDTGAGFSYYKLILSTDPGFSSTQIFTTQQNFLDVDSNLFPSGTLYRYVQAIDHVGNISYGLPGFFTNTSLAGGNVSSISNHGTNPPSGKKTNPDISEHHIAGEEEQIPEKDTSKKPLNLKEVAIRNIKKRIYTRSQTRKKIQQNKSGEVVQGQGQNIYEQLALPGYLARTGADPQIIQKYLLLLATRSPNEQVRNQLHQIIHFIQPSRPIGTLLFIILLCYDIEIWRKRQKIKVYSKKRKHKKSH